MWNPSLQPISVFCKQPLPHEQLHFSTTVEPHLNCKQTLGTNSYISFEIGREEREWEMRKIEAVERANKMKGMANLSNLVQKLRECIAASSSSFLNNVEDDALELKFYAILSNLLRADIVPSPSSGTFVGSLALSHWLS